MSISYKTYILENHDRVYYPCMWTDVYNTWVCMLICVICNVPIYMVLTPQYIDSPWAKMVSSMLNEDLSQWKRTKFWRDSTQYWSLENLVNVSNEKSCYFSSVVLNTTFYCHTAFSALIILNAPPCLIVPIVRLNIECIFLSYAHFLLNIPRLAGSNASVNLVTTS